MLAGLRSAAKSKLAVPVIALLAISFAVWGVSDAFTSSTRDSVATVGREKVTIDEFSRAFRTQVQSLMQQTGETITTPEARQAGLDRQLLGQLITGAALDAKAGDLKLRASDAAISRDIRTTPSFQDTVRGEFSRDVYLSALANVGMTPADYEASLRKDVARQQILNAVLPPVHAPSVLTAAREAYANERRTAEVLVLPAALAQVDETPDDAALQSILDEYSAQFTFPELRAVTVVWLDMNSMQAIVQVSDEDVQALYDFRRDSLATPATRDFVQLAAPDEATADAAAARLEAGDDPAAIAADLGLAEPIVADAATRLDVVDSAVADRIFDSTEPRSFAVEGGLGWAAVRVTGGVEATEPSFEASEAQLRAELAEDGATDTLYDAVAALEDARGAGMTLEQAAAAAGVWAESYPPISSRAMDADGAIYTDLAQAPDVLGAIFRMNLSETSDVLELPDGGYAMVRVDDITPPRVATLDEAREDAETLWRARSVDDRLREIEDDARAQIEGGASFADAAEAIGQPARSELAVMRRGQTSGPVDAQLSASLFEAQQGELVSGRTAGDSRVLARVTKVEVAPPEGDDDATETMSDELANDLMQQFQTALQDEYPVRVFEDQIDLALGEAPADQ